MAHCTLSGRLRNIAVLTLLLFSTLVLAGCRQKASIVQGEVRDARTNQPLPGALVRVADQVIETPRSGKFRLEVAVGAHRIEVAAPGYVTQVFSTTIKEMDSRFVCEAVLTPRSLVGTARDAETGQHLQGVSLHLGDRSESTSSDGGFQLDARLLAPLRVSSPGYLPLEIPESDIAALFDPMGTMAEPLALDLHSRVLSGTVHEADTSAPVQGVAIALGETTLHSDAQGNFEVRGIEPGITITVSHPGYHPVDPILYSSQETLDVQMVPWVVALTLVDRGNDAPLAQRPILVGEQQLQTDATGTATLRAVPGQSLAIATEGYRPVELLFEGQDTVQIALEATHLTAELIDKESGQSIVGALIQVFTEGAEPALLRSDQQGRCVIPDSTGVTHLTVKAPGYRLATVPIKTGGAVRVAMEPFEVRAIYIPFGLLTLPETIDALLAMVDETDLNAVVVDVKSDRAWLAWDSQVPLARETDAYIEQAMDLREFVAKCHAKGIYAIARMVVFKDDLLAEVRPEFAVKRASGEPYVDLEGLRWVDPFRQEVQDYNIALAKEVIAQGFDEIQFDYLRFPSDGSVQGITYSQEATLESRTTAITAFCRQAYEAISLTPAFFSADIFGLTVWVSPGVDMGIGQRVEDIAPYVDYISPMLYPTTFTKGNLGYDQPWLKPYEVIYRSVRKLGERTATKVRPWLQAYSLRGMDYGPAQLLLQSKGADDAESCGWIFWNASGKYDAELFTPDAASRYPEVVAAQPPATE
ncbi:MAG: putative glycoside hydrolase [Anaerolineae bacterium]